MYTVCQTYKVRMSDIYRISDKYSMSDRYCKSDIPSMLDVNSKSNIYSMSIVYINVRRLAVSYMFNLHLLKHTKARTFSSFTQYYTRRYTCCLACLKMCCMDFYCRHAFMGIKTITGSN